MITCTSTLHTVTFFNSQTWFSAPPPPSLGSEGVPNVVASQSIYQIYQTISSIVLVLMFMAVLFVSSSSYEEIIAIFYLFIYFFTFVAKFPPPPSPSLPFPSRVSVHALHSPNSSALYSCMLYLFIYLFRSQLSRWGCWGARIGEQVKSCRTGLTRQNRRNSKQELLTILWGE